MSVLETRGREPKGPIVLAVRLGGILGPPLGRLHGGNRRLSVERGSPWRINLMR